jgi:Xaa-Pro aminopeptidase
MKDIKIDGRPHVGVGISISLGAATATGLSTAFAHPNQFHYSKIKRGDAVDIRGHLVIGGYHAECYRPFQILPWDSYREKVWETVVEGVRIQERESKEGVPACDVAYKIHTYQVAQGFQKLIKHRPGHGKGMEGHQPPHCALGETTILKEGMMFSCEPGLFDVEKGFGYRPSETLLVTKKKGVLMMAVPYTKEWMVLKL